MDLITKTMRTPLDIPVKTGIFEQGTTFKTVCFKILNFNPCLWKSLQNIFLVFKGILCAQV